MERFTDKVVLITGSSSGIGEAAARQFAAEGARLVVNSSRSVEAGEAVAASLPDAIYVQGDVADETACAHLIDATLDHYGRLDVLVNNAGTTQVIPHHDLETASPDVFRRIFEVNVFGTWALTRLAMPALRADGGGSVVNVTSVAGVRPTGSSIPYAMSKAALEPHDRIAGECGGPGSTRQRRRSGAGAHAMDGGLGSVARRHEDANTTGSFRGG